MPDRTKYDLEYRPEYWNDAVRIVLANIKGEYRRRRALELIRQGRTESLSDWLITERLPIEDREFTGKIHPALMGGEYLPHYGSGEVEIARVSIRSVTSDVISIRAKMRVDRITYRIVDEYETGYRFQPKSTAKPLTLGEIVGLIDGVKVPGGSSHRGLTTMLRESNRACEPEKLADFVKISSAFYPDLERWYEEEAREWLATERKAPPWKA